MNVLKNQIITVDKSLI